MSMNKVLIKLGIWVLLLLPCALSAQGYGILAENLCWNADSNVIRLTQISTSTPKVRIISYINVAGDTVSVSGGTLTYGICECCVAPPSGAFLTPTNNPFENRQLPALVAVLPPRKFW